ncbi:cell division protein DivIVA [Bifidobacterium primatium]|uniref:Cell division protein DivIVA n=1 Tax=Bifidobacterium primatium TaxID=2045438 RepID=A0A2M9HA55_9BIFI|nr:DivIVA domain-containing protein [Bifidobacterium primatium]PJM73681.1 cell division protein DivIVA [Bifidobacterium primatium]
MAQQRAADRNGASIARAGKRKWGYDVGQVDSFLERAHTLYEDAEPKMTQEDIQNVSFALEKDGYVISQVDAALNRLEKAVVDKQTQWDVNTTGRVAWRATTEQLAHSLYPRAKRPAKERFAPGADKRPSYDRKQVDRLVDQIVEKIRHELGETRQHQSDAAARAEAELTSVKVSNVIFTQRKGKRGYSERQVDAYLNRAVQVLSRLESFARLEGSLHLDDMEPLDAEPQSSQSRPTQALFGAVPQAKADVRAGQEGYGYAVPPAPAVESVPAAAAQSVVEEPSKDDARSERDSSFYDLRQAESALVNSTTDSTPAADTPAAAVSGSLAGLVNGTSSVAAQAEPEPAPSSNDMPTTAIPPLPDALPAQEPSFPLVDSRIPSYEPTSHSFDFVSGDDTGASASVDSADTPAAPRSTAAGAEPSIWSSASSRAAGASDAFDASTDSVPADDAASGSGGASRDRDAHASDSPFSGDEAGDYFSSLLDTSSIPSVDFHIPSLTFPSADDRDGKDGNGSGKY